MDQDRQIRFVIPPFFLLASLLWGAHLGGCDLLSKFKPDNAKDQLGVLAATLGVLAATAVLIVPAGYLISIISETALRILAKIRRWPTYEAHLKDDTLGRIWDQLHIKDDFAKDKKKALYATATFDHELLDKGVHTWLMRRWNSFNVAVHSIVALLLAHVFALPIQFRHIAWWWWTWTIVLVLILLCLARSSWRETMAMIEIQSYRQQKPKEGS
jgi:hypothetical protein